MAHCTQTDVEEYYPTLTEGVDENLVAALCANASDVIDFYTLIPNPEDAVLKKATVHQVAAWLETGNLQEFGLIPTVSIKIGSETFTIAQHLCAAAKRVLHNNGYTQPWGC